MTKQKYHQEYWKQYRQQNKRVSFTLPLAEYKQHEKRAQAHNRSVSQQLYLEAQAYRENRFLPSPEIASKINSLILAIRQLYSLLQTLESKSFLGSNPWRKTPLKTKLQQLDQTIDRFVVPTHDHKKPCSQK